jgi:hypothetical protein
MKKLNEQTLLFFIEFQCYLNAELNDHCNNDKPNSLCTTGERQQQPEQPSMSTRLFSK